MPPVEAALNVKRWPLKFSSDDKRVITRFLDFGVGERTRGILALSDDRVRQQLAQVHRDFAARHRDADAAGSSGPTSPSNTPSSRRPCSTPRSCCPRTSRAWARARPVS